MKGSIRLHKEKGVNPFLTYCPRCRGEAPDIILVGADDSVYRCGPCEIEVIAGNGGKCPKCKKRTLGERIRTLEERERLPGGLCEGCEKEVAEFYGIVSGGGIFWRCIDCRIEGVAKAGSGIAVAVRQKTGIKPPDPVGVELDKESCPACTAKTKGGGA